MPVNAIKPLRYVLQAQDGRMVTYDMTTGAALTANRALSYVWTDAAEAERQRRAYEAVLGHTLTVQWQQPKQSA
jgi:hypothetical protein